MKLIYSIVAGVAFSIRQCVRKDLPTTHFVGHIPAPVIESQNQHYVPTPPAAAKSAPSAEIHNGGYPSSVYHQVAYSQVAPPSPPAPIQTQVVSTNSATSDCINFFGGFNSPPATRSVPGGACDRTDKFNDWCECDNNKVYFTCIFGKIIERPISEAQHCVQPKNGNTPILIVADSQ